MTFKQLEALYWVVKLGGFHAAADRLHTTQSTISQRIRELETTLNVELFDRRQRASRLTAKGEELVIKAKQLLALREETLALAEREVVAKKVLRLGVTELTAITWLPQMVECLQSRYPQLVIEPAIDMSTHLYQALLEDRLDLIFIPHAYHSPALIDVPIGRVENALMAKRGLVDCRQSVTLESLRDFCFLADKSGPGLIYNQWFDEHGFRPKQVLTSNSVIALLGFTLSGLGISYFPRSALQPLVDSQRLDFIPLTPSLPPVAYHAMYPANQQSRFMDEVVGHAKQCCSFEHILGF